MRLAQLLAGTAVLLLALPARAGDWGGLFSAVTLTSDYRFQGVSSSDGPALQGYVHWWRPDGLYAGVFASQVDHGYPGDPSVEVDVYGGKTFRLDQGRTELKLEAMYSSFPDDETWGPTLAFWQVKAAAQRRVGDLTWNVAASYTPQASYRGGEAWLAETQVAYAVTPAVRLKGALGGRWSAQQPDRTFWSLAAVATWRALTFEARYEDTDLSPAECGLRPGACDGGLVGAVTVALPPIL